MDALNLTNNLNHADLLQGQNQLARLRQEAGSLSGDEKKLKQAAREFEAIFVQQLLDAMDKTVDRQNSLFGNSSSEQYFRGMLNEEVAKSMVNRTGGSGFGLAEAIYRQTSAQVKPASESIQNNEGTP